MPSVIVTAKIRGISPLLMNSPKSMVRPTGGMNMKKIPSPEDEAESKTYRLENGALYLPTIAFRSCLLSATTGRRIGKFSAKGIVAGAVFVVDENTPLTDPDTGKPLKNYEIHVARAVIQKNSVMRARPKIPVWGCTVRFEIDEDFIPDPALVLQLLNIGGKSKGVGDWRPEKMGPYGRFTAEPM